MMKTQRYSCKGSTSGAEQRQKSATANNKTHDDASKAVDATNKMTAITVMNMMSTANMMGANQ